MNDGGRVVLNEVIGEWRFIFVPFVSVQHEIHLRDDAAWWRSGPEWFSSSDMLAAREVKP